MEKGKNKYQFIIKTLDKRKKIAYNNRYNQKFRRISFMAIKSNLKMHPVSWLITQNKAGKLNKNISIQRKEVWDPEKKSNLIVTLLLDIPLESLLFEDIGNRHYNVLDGKQRTLTLCSYESDGFALSSKIRIKEIDGVQLVGKKFSDLPEEFKSRITEYQLSISILDKLDAEERGTVFFMRNQAAPLTKMDLSPVVLGEEAMRELDELCQHSFFKAKFLPTPSSIRKRDDLKIILQYFILRTGQDAGFSGAEIMSICDDIKNGEVEIGAERVVKILNYLDEAIPQKTAYLRIIHIPSIMFIAQQAKEKGIQPADFGKRLFDFFMTTARDSEFTAACQQGSAKKTNVQTRVRLMNQILGDEVNDV